MTFAHSRISSASRSSSGSCDTIWSAWRRSQWSRPSPPEPRPSPIFDTVPKVSPQPHSPIAQVEGAHNHKSVNLRTENRSVSLTLLAALFLAACDAEPTKDQRIRAEAEAELAMLADPVMGAAELDRRLRERVKIEAGIVVLRTGRLSETKALAASVPWSVTCGGMGIWVGFGDGEAAGAYGEQAVQISAARSRTTPHCEAISIKLGQVLSAMIAAPGRDRLREGIR